MKIVLHHDFALMLPERPVHLQEIAATGVSGFIVGSTVTAIELSWSSVVFHPREKQRREPYL